MDEYPQNGEQQDADPTFATSRASLYGVADAWNMGLSSLSGCSRQFWRKQADKDSYNAVAEKLTDPALAGAEN